MKILFTKSLWGMEDLELKRQFEIIAEAGYDGIEDSPPSPDKAERYERLLREYKFVFVANLWTHGDHIAQFAQQLQYGAAFKPLLFVSHSARDCMPFEEQCRFFERALDLEREVGIPVAHETHRSRPLFTPWTTASLLRAFPDLKLNADFSHWCCVCESLLEDHTDSLDLAIERSIHIHSRVGYPQGPQVPHPAAPEWQKALEAHLAWWKRIVETRERSEAEYLAITPEFGPPDYFPTLPFTNQPVADLWEICLWMRERVKAELQRS